MILKTNCNLTKLVNLLKLKLFNYGTIIKYNSSQNTIYHEEDYQVISQLDTQHINLMENE